MTLPSKKIGRLKKIVGRIVFSTTLIFGFIAILFTRDFGGAGKLFQEPKDGGTAHADAPSGGDSGGYSAGDTGACADCGSCGAGDGGTGSGSGGDSGGTGGDSGGGGG